MKRTLLTLAAVFVAFCLDAQQIEKYSPEYMSACYKMTDVMIPMRDGVELFTRIYEPKDASQKHPVMMERTCYSARPRWAPESFRDMHAYAPYVDAGYIFVFQDVRGKNMSEGDFDNIRPFIEGKKLEKKASKNIGKTDEASDTYDTVEWIVNNTNNNGCVGLAGISYPGFYATMGALSAHPALKAVSPQAPVSDWFHGDDVHHNGALMLAESIGFEPWFEFALDNKLIRNGGNPAALKLPDIRPTDVYSDYLRIGTYDNICKAYADSVEYFRTIREHPDWDEYWISHTVLEGHMHDVKPAVMVVGGLFDKEDCYGAFATYKAIRDNSPETDLYLVDGPWWHGAWNRGMKPFWKYMYFGDEAVSEYYMKTYEYPFFAYYLEGKGEKPQTGADVFDSGSRTWTHYDRWPLVQRSETTPYYLHSDGTVSTSLPSGKAVASYVSDPSKPVPYHGEIESGISKDYMTADQRFAAQRPDVLVFQTPVLAEDLCLAGEVEVDLHVDISTTDADFIVKVIDVFPDGFSWKKEVGLDSDFPRYPMAGYQLMVRGEVMRGKYRESFSSPLPFEPGKTTEVRFTMPDISHTFKPGHRLMIQVQSTWFPLVDRNPQTFCDIYTCDESAYTTSTINIHCDSDAASCVKLPVRK